MALKRTTVGTSGDTPEMDKRMWLRRGWSPAKRRQAAAVRRALLKASMKGQAKVVAESTGGLKMRVRYISPDEELANIKAGQQALARLAKANLTLVVKDKTPPHIPAYSVDPQDPSVLIEKLNGVKRRGHFVDGKFRPEV